VVSLVRWDSFFLWEGIMSNVIGTCYVKVRKQVAFTAPLPLIFMFEPNDLRPDEVVIQFDNPFTAKKYINSFVKHQPVKIVKAA
jgi:hypothetical protein